jgi:uncharacterized membrane protein (DUF373 family)
VYGSPDQRCAKEYRVKSTELIKKFEGIIVTSLMTMIGLVIFLETMELAWLIVRDIVTPPILLLEPNELLEIFGFFMLILIGLELLEIMQNYHEKRRIRVEIVLIVALIAIARKVIIVDHKDLTSFTLLDLGVLTVALAVALYLLNKGRGNLDPAGGKGVHSPSIDGTE